MCDIENRRREGGHGSLTAPSVKAAGDVKQLYELVCLLSGSALVLCMYVSRISVLAACAQDAFTPPDVLHMWP